MPNPATAITSSTAMLASAAAATRTRSRAVRGASTRNGSTMPALSFTPMPATSAAAAPRMRGSVPADSTSAPASAASTSVSLWAPPTASTSSTGFRPTNAAAQRRETPRRPAACAVRATAARLPAAAATFSSHSPAARPAGASA
jgi:hypothetical protein